MEPKYELTENKLEIENEKGVMMTLWQIKATKDITIGTDDYEQFISKGTLGGYISKESNLSQEGRCWIDEKSYVFDNAVVSDDALLLSSRLYDSAQISGDAYLRASVIGGESSAKDYSSVYESRVEGESILCGYTSIEHSIVENLKLFSPDTREYWHSFVFKKVTLNNTFVRLYLPCKWKNVVLDKSMIVAKDHTIFENVRGEKCNIMNQAKLMLMNTELLSGTKITSAEGNGSYILGHASEDDKSPYSIQVNSSFLKLDETTIQGRISINGSFIIERSDIRLYNKLLNESTIPLRLVDVHLKDCSEIHVENSFFKKNRTQFARTFSKNLSEDMVARLK